MQSPSTRHPSDHAAQRYEVKEQIAQGGMGMVYRALDRSTGQEVALKRVYIKQASRRALYTAAFEREYQVLASLDHPRIIRVFDYGVDSAGPYYTMELVAGRDLSRAAPLPWREVCKYMRDLATSLSLLHARRLLHRDLSPGNVKIGVDGHAKLLDFGALSDFGFTNWLIGTPPLVPPEALRGEQLDQRADLYALGGLAYWALTGQHAFAASKLDDLPTYWDQNPRPPSAFVPDIPKALDQLVLSLLSREPLARPASAAEVIVRLNVIGQLPLEDVGERRRLAQSFLIVPPFVGRDEELAELNSHLKQACNGRGSAVRIEAVAGSGRSRLLEEIGVRAQLTGATVLRADASMHPNHHGTSRALAMRLLDTLPDVAREYSRRYAHHLLALGRDIESLLGGAPLKPQRERDAGGEPLTDPGGDLADWFVDVSHHKPLVITVDNVEFCDAASLGVLVTLSARARHESIFIVVAERTRRDRKTAKGLSVLREQCQTLALSNLAPSETLALARSLFGDAPNVERFAEFLHSRTAGSPLHCVEMSRQLIASEVIRHEGGMWILPASRPHVELPEALEGALSVRISNLGPQALALAQCLSMQRGEPTLALCTQLTEPSAQRSSEQEALVLLDELARNDVLLRDRSGYRFSSSALRDALVAGQDELEREACHTRLGKAFEHLAREAPRLLLEAGWHWMRGGDELRGADLIAYVLREGASVRGLSANGYQLGPIADGALRIYKRHRRTAYERMPLLAAVAQAGYYEDHAFTDRFGDEALDVIEDLAGLRTARRLRRYFGGSLALALGVGLAVLRFFITPKRERSYPFMELFHNAFSTVAAMVGTATMSLDADRADRIARVLEPFSVLPEQTTARGIYDFCVGLQQIGRERQPETFAVFDSLCRRLQEPGRYRLVPPDARPLFVTSAHFARGAFAIFRADGAAALESVAALEASGYTLYTMVASQLRFLYHANRGELAEAARQRALVELHAARSGSAWQVELWEPGALLPLYLALGDVVALSRIVRRFDELVRVAPSLQFYRRLAEFALAVRRDQNNLERLLPRALRELERRPPRSFIGWTTLVSTCAEVFNRLERHEEARAMCEHALGTMRAGDREYVSLFLELELQTALADAGLARFDDAFARIDGLLALHGPTQHPFALGSLHEVRARISYRAGKKRDYHYHLTQMERWFRPTGTPTLIAKCERVAELQHAQETARHRPVVRHEPREEELNTDLLEMLSDD